MPLIGFFLASWRRGSRLRQISQALGAPTQFSAENIFVRGAELDDAEKQLYDLVESDPTLKAVMAEHGATRQTVEGIYYHLLKAGAGKWVRGHWLTASALAYGATLDFVLGKLTSLPGREGSNLVVSRLAACRT